MDNLALLRQSIKTSQPFVHLYVFDPPPHREIYISMYIKSFIAYTNLTPCMEGGELDGNLNNCS